MRRLLKAAAVYFLLVFAAGVVLGVLRERWVKDMIGARAAEVAEVPLMIGLSALAAIWVVGRYGLRHQRSKRLAVGLLALALLLVAELTVVLALRGMTLDQYLASRDPTSFAAYLVGLLFFAVMPAVVRVGRRPQGY